MQRYPCGYPTKVQTSKQTCINFQKPEIARTHSGQPHDSEETPRAQGYPCGCEYNTTISMHHFLNCCILQMRELIPSRHKIARKHHEHKGIHADTLYEYQTITDVHHLSNSHATASKHHERRGIHADTMLRKSKIMASIPDFQRAAFCHCLRMQELDQDSLATARRHRECKSIHADTLCEYKTTTNAYLFINVVPADA